MMHEVRCCKCSKLLARVSGIGSVEVKCPRCKFINNLKAESLLDDRQLANTDRRLHGQRKKSTRQERL